VSIQLRCRHCDRRLAIDSRKAGQTVTCPACKKTLKVPATASAPTAPAVASTAPKPAKPASAPAAPRRAPLGLAIAVSVGCLVIAVPLVCLAVAVPLLLHSRSPVASTTHEPEPVAAVMPAGETALENPTPPPPKELAPVAPLPPTQPPQSASEPARTPAEPVLPEPPKPPDGKPVSPAPPEEKPNPPKPPERKPNPPPVVPPASPVAVAAPPRTEAGKVPEALKYSAIAAVFEAHAGKMPAAMNEPIPRRSGRHDTASHSPGKIPSSGEELTTALASVGQPAQLPVSFSAVALDSGLANPRVVLAPGVGTKSRGGRSLPEGALSAGWSPATAEGPARTSSISQAEVNTPDFTGRLYFAVNTEHSESGTTHARSVEFISWNSQRKKFDFGVIDNLSSPGAAQLQVVDGVKCFSCHKTHGPILGGGPWSNTTHNSLLRTAATEALSLPTPSADLAGPFHPRLPTGFDAASPSGARFDGIDLLSAQALEVDAHVRLGAERLRNREAFRLLTRYPGGSKLLALLLGGLVASAPAAKPGDPPAKPGDLPFKPGMLPFKPGDFPGMGGKVSHDAAPLAKADEELNAKIDQAFPPGSFSDRWLESQKAAPSSILLDFSPAGPPPSQPNLEWGGTPALVKKYDATRTATPVVLPSQRLPSNPKAFLKPALNPVRPSKTINVTRLAETIGVSEADRDFLARTLNDAAARIGNTKVTPATLTAAVFEGPTFADVLKEGTLPDRDEFKDRFMAGLKEVLEKKYNQANAIAVNRSDYASAPEFVPGAEEPEPVLVPTTACQRCHEIRPSGKAKFSEPLPALAFDPFDKKSREAWVANAEPQRRQHVLNRMLKRLVEDKDMPPEDAPEFDKFRTKTPAAFDAVQEFLEAELKKVKGD
jgi:phage FluMu protein Com